jgi:flagellar hook-associated protein 2
MRIAVSGDPVLQGLFSYGPGINSALTQKTAAQDAQLTVDGKAVTSSTNKLEAAIPGVALTLKETGKSDVSVARSSSAIAGNIKHFVAAFNTMSTKLGGLKTGDGANDAMLNQVQAQLGQVLDGADTKALAEMGITRRNGALVLDEGKLNAAVAADPDKATQLFSKPGTGLADQFTTRITQQMTTGGILAKQAASVQGEVDKLTAKKAQVADVINKQASMLVQQYSQAGLGGSSLFGIGGGARPMSLFDFMA